MSLKPANHKSTPSLTFWRSDFWISILTVDQRFCRSLPNFASRSQCVAFQLYTILLIKRYDSLEIKFSQRRQRIADFATQSLEDKSSHVRRHSIKLISRMLSTHPFAVMHGGQLDIKEWQHRLDKVNAELKTVLPPIDEEAEVHNPGDLSRIDEGLLDTASEAENDDAGNETVIREQYENIELINKLNLTKRYYTEALAYIQSLHKASSSICSLLSAKNKGEVIEAMDFFVIADAYKLQPARDGIRKMLHLIWTNANNDEGKGIQIHLVDCYRSLFFTAPEEFSESDRCTFIARNLISLTYGASAAELTSLERLLINMMKNNQMPQLVIQKLWQVYGVQQRDISKSQRRGAIMIIGMLAAFDSGIVVRELETLYHVGLGAYGKQDLVLARYTCVALQRMSAATQKLPEDHVIFQRLCSIMESYSENKEWYPLAEQAINAVYSLAKKPDLLCGNTIKQKTRAVFAGELSESTQKPKSSTCALSQLLFLVGHIASKHSVLIDTAR